MDYHRRGRFPCVSGLFVGVLLMFLVDSSDQAGSVTFKVLRLEQSYRSEDSGQRVVGEGRVIVETNVPLHHQWQEKVPMATSVNRYPLIDDLEFPSKVTQMVSLTELADVFEYSIAVSNTTDYHYLDLGLETEDQSIVFKQGLVFIPQAQDLTHFHTYRKENLTEIVKALPAITHVERGDEMTLSCSILVPMSKPQYAIVDWTLFTPGVQTTSGIPKPKSLFFYKNVGGEVKTSNYGNKEYIGGARADPFNKVGGRSGSTVSSHLSLGAFNPREHSGEYSCHIHVDGITVKMSSVVVPQQVSSLFLPKDIRVHLDLCDGGTVLQEDKPGCVRCTALGHPVPELVMYHNGTELESMSAGMHWGRPRDTAIAYHIMPTVDESRVGEYECWAKQVATEVVSSDSMNVTLAIAP